MPSQPPITNPTLVSEESSQRELASTIISKPVAIAMSLGFCALLLIPLAFHRGAISMPAAFPTRESLQELTRAIDESSPLKRFVQPRLQALLSRSGGFGNESVTIGRDGWLYYTPGLRYITGPPFLNPAYLKAKAKAMIDKNGLTNVHPDPLPAFRQLAADCRRLQIHLILLPVPDKGMLAPEHLTGTPARGPLNNPDFETFRDAVESLGAEVFTLAPPPGGGSQRLYLRQDTHWTPAFMDSVAQRLSVSLRAKNIGPPAGQPARYKRGSQSVSSVGDLVTMLKLPPGQSLFGQETVQVSPVEPAGPSIPEPPEVILLGDSFTNIYSSPSLDWGEHAGLGDQLAYHINAPVDVIARNGAGASVRQELLRAARTGRLASTRAIVYEFAVRDLYVEDWPPLSLGEIPRTPPPAAKPISALVEPQSAPAPAPAKTPVTSPKKETSELIISGTITFMSRAIDPASAPYDDALIYAKLRVDRVESGVYSKPDAIIAFPAMEKRNLLPGAAHKAGQSLRLQLIPLRTASATIRAMQRSDDTEDFDLVPYFVQAELK
jgi:alginate O-acetyltransferase complex protein AlgJ